MNIQAYAAHELNGKLESFQYELGDLKPDEVELDVEYCGICHSDLSMLKNEWGLTRYPFVLETSLPGVFAVGDIRSGSVKRVASAVGEGSIAISFVYRVLQE